MRLAKREFKWVPLKSKSPASIQPAGLGKCRKLAFAELELLPRTRLAGLLSLLLARVTREVARFLERLAQFAVLFFQCTGDAEANRAGLTGDAAARHIHANVCFLVKFNRLERFNGEGALVFNSEVFLNIPAVDRDLAGSISEAHPGHGPFAASCS